MKKLNPSEKGSKGRVSILKPQNG
uniref:Uncharacterized protein n=1 Tax=Anguilla anguilla TaxID=7936 RepID=A0A0E9VZP5_ANGAN